jgi:hypothetical protein
MTAAAQAFDTFLPFWRASIPPSIPLAYFDAFVVRMRPTLETIVGGFFERRQARRDQSLPPESMTKASRTRRNLEAMRIVATRRPQDMNADERRAVLGYSGWGGLSIEAVMDQFPPGLVPDDFALAHEFFTPPPVAGEISDIVCRYLAELAGHDGIVRALEPSVGIGRLIHPMGPPRCLVTDPRYKETRWTAVELSEVSAKMFAAMRPDVELYAMSLERWMSEHAARYQGTDRRRRRQPALWRPRRVCPARQAPRLPGAGGLRLFHAPLPRSADPARPRGLRDPRRLSDRLDQPLAARAGAAASPPRGRVSPPEREHHRQGPVSGCAQCRRRALLARPRRRAPAGRSRRRLHPRGRLF